MGALAQIGRALSISAAMTWEILWALMLGFALSATVRVVVPRADIARVLGDDSTKTLGTATLLGAASSSCSYAAVALARSLFRKGASFSAAMVFEIASTNLVIELGIIIWLRRGLSPNGFRVRDASSRLVKAGDVWARQAGCEISYHHVCARHDMSGTVPFVCSLVCSSASRRNSRFSSPTTTSRTSAAPESVHPPIRSSPCAQGSRRLGRGARVGRRRGMQARYCGPLLSVPTRLPQSSPCEMDVRDVAPTTSLTTAETSLASLGFLVLKACHTKL